MPLVAIGQLRPSQTRQSRPKPATSGHLRLVAALFATLLAAGLLSGCLRDREHSAQFYVFGTIIEVKTWGASNEQAGEAFAALQQMFQSMHRDWHAWEPGMLMDINRAFAAGETVEASGQIAEMIRRSQDIEAASEGRFNPAIGKLIGRWGFHTSEYPIIGPPPGRDEIDQLLGLAPSSRDIRIEGVRLASANRSVQLDFGGIAKGYAVDLAVARLRDLGIDNAIVNAGGDLRAMGRHGKRPWRVAVRKPHGGAIGGIEVRGDEALFTSGNYERFRQDDEQRYPHIIDPRTGWPVHDVASVTVIADEGLLADAAATALVVAGLDAWPRVARALQIEQVMVIDGSGTVFLTPAMARRVRFTEDVEPVMVP